jgi:hypothetical protein
MAIRDRKNRFDRHQPEQASRSGSRDKLNNKFPTFQPNSTKNERYYQNQTVTSEDDEINGAETELVSKSANKLLRIIKTPTRLGLDFKSPQGGQLFDENYPGSLTGLMRGQQLIDELRCHSPLILNQKNGQQSVDRRDLSNSAHNRYQSTKPPVMDRP